MDRIFLGAVLSFSSTTIIVKSLRDTGDIRERLGLRGVGFGTRRIEGVGDGKDIRVIDGAIVTPLDPRPAIRFRFHAGAAIDEIWRRVNSELRHGVRGALQPLELRVDRLHEAVEVKTPLVRERQGVEEEVEQPGLAAADAAPEVGPWNGGQRTPAEAAPQAVRPVARARTARKRAADLRQHAERGALRGVVGEALLRDRLLVTGLEVHHWSAAGEARHFNGGRAGLQAAPAVSRETRLQ